MKRYKKGTEVHSDTIFMDRSLMSSIQQIKPRAKKLNPLNLYKKEEIKYASSGLVKFVYITVRKHHGPL